MAVTEQATERPAGLPGNFKTVEALATSYGEAQRKLHEQAAELKALRAELEARPADPALFAAELADHREAFFQQLRAEAERLLGVELRLAQLEESDGER